MIHGVVSVRRRGRVIVKAVAGCDGMNADKLAAAIRTGGVVAAMLHKYAGLPASGPLITAADIYELALDREIGFGCMGCLVVQDENETIFHGDDELELLYVDKFADPRFNPRRESGQVEYVAVVDLPAPSTKEEGGGA